MIILDYLGSSWTYFESIGIAITNIAIYRQAIVNIIPVDFYISDLLLSSMIPHTSELSDLRVGVIACVRIITHTLSGGDNGVEEEVGSQLLKVGCFGNDEDVEMRLVYCCEYFHCWRDLDSTTCSES